MLQNDEFIIKDYTIGFGRANVISFVLIIPILLFFLLPYILIWDYESFKAGRDVFGDYIVPLLLGGIIVHEFLHGITWMFFASGKMKSIKFGIKWEYLTPYCHCKEGLKINHYRIGGAMPLVVMGLIPSLIAIISGNGFLLCFGIVFTWVAAGDIIIIFVSGNIERGIYVFDHPDKIGFYTKDSRECQDS